jgi:HSP20 family molecular chaperone IbpA
MSFFNRSGSLSRPFNQARNKEDQKTMARTEQSPAATHAQRLALPVDIYENENELLLLADLPGVEPDGLNVSFDAGELRIEGRRGPAETGSLYTRTFRVSERIDPAGISAELNQGVLKLRLAKAEHSKPRKIEVRAA